MKSLVSVIVPVYKVEKYLPRCLDSLKMQSLKNIEIILIDDASPDQCGGICEQYAAEDRRFRAYHHSENQGVSAARNTGISHASSEYLMFVDSDDWVHADYCKDAYESAVKNRADLVMFGYQEVQNTASQDKYIVTCTSGLRSHKEAVDLSFTAFGTIIWNKLYHRDLFDKIRFPEGRRYEDTAISYKLIWKSSRVYCIEKVLYYYFRHAESFTRQKPTRKTVREQFEVCWRQYSDLSNWGFHSVQLELFKDNIALNYCMKTASDFSDPYYAFSADIIRCIKNTPQSLTWKRNILVKLFQRSPNLFNLICSLLNKHVK